MRKDAPPSMSPPQSGVGLGPGEAYRGAGVQAERHEREWAVRPKGMRVSGHE